MKPANSAPPSPTVITVVFYFPFQFVFYQRALILWNIKYIRNRDPADGRICRGKRVEPLTSDVLNLERKAMQQQYSTTQVK